MGRRTNTSVCVAVSIFLLALAATAAGRIIYVDDDANGANDGSKWTNAFNYLQDALAEANSAGDVNEIRVAQGTYTPDSNSADPNGSGDRTATFQLINGVNLKGGYAGYGAPDPNARDVGLYETILSGDLDGNDVDLNEPSDLHHDSTRSENSFSVVTGSGTDRSAVLDGFTITAGHANDLQADVNSPANNGSGMYNNAGSPTVLNCTFLRNSAKLIWSPVRIAGGGGMFNLNSSPALHNCKFVENIIFTGELISAGGGMFNINSNPTLVNCLFSSNVATGFDSDYIGGGMCNYGSGPSLVDCSFVGNLAYWGGGGMFNDYNSTPALTGCTFRNNWGHYYGGAMFSERSALILTDCAFQQNAANISGGGIHNDRDCRSTITNCTFSANATGGRGGGMYNYYGTSVTVTNCKFVENRAGGEGGGMAGNNAELILRQCTFSANAATMHGGGGLSAYRCGATITRCVFSRNLAGGSGGAVYCLWCDALLNDCTVSDNRSGRRGGGILVSDSKPILTRCKFSGNRAGSDGGGIYCEEISSPTIINCAITGNRARYNGGGIFSWDASSPTVVNCTISGNAALDKGGGICYEEHGRLIVRDCIVWGNTASDGNEMAVGGASTADVNYCDVKGGREGVYVSGDYTLNWGPGNIDAEPRFVEPGYWDSNGTPGDVNDDFWVGGDNHLMAASPCIDAGDPNYVPEPNETDLDGNPRVLDGDNDGNSVVDIGAYEHRIIYVDADANGANDGSSWADAFNYLQDGLAAAKYGDEIRVAEGIYKPDQNSLHPDGTGDRDATFQLVSGVAVRGGYAGFGEPDPNVRDTELYETILSGDLDGNDADVNEPSDLPSEPTRGENSYHVVTSISSNQTTLLDGFTVTGGNANSDGHWEGAGVYLFNSTAEIMNCSISGNKAFRGGGVLCHGGSPTIIRCTITGNVAGTKNSWGNRGGGILCSGSGPVITECIISENFTLGRWAEGGGIYGCGGPISNCTITGNWVGDRGGGLAFCTGPITSCTISNNTAHRDSGGLTFCDGPITNCTISGNCAQQEDTGGLGACDGPITNCIITGNWAARDAGAIGSCDGTIINCVITGNWAGRYGGGLRNAYGGPTLTNCILSFNAASDGNEIALMLYSTMDVKYCDVAGGQTDIYIDSTSTINWGQGNMDVDPCFADVDSNDYRLRPGSPCIDAGDNNSVPSDTTDLDGDGNTTEPIPWDLDGNPRMVDGNNDGTAVVDMGAYEFFWPPIQVSMKLTPQAVNPGSQGRWVKAHFVFPEDFGLEDVDAGTPAKIAEPFEPNIEAEYMNVFINEEGLVEVEAGFYRAEFCAAAVDGNTVEVSVVGSLTSGQEFYGTDTVKITNNAFKHLADLASYWLEESCDQPDWCGGLDLDQSGALDFVDLALFDGCCIETIP